MGLLGFSLPVGILRWIGDDEYGNVFQENVDLLSGLDLSLLAQQAVDQELRDLFLLFQEEEVDSVFVVGNGEHRYYALEVNYRSTEEGKKLLGDGAVDRA